MKDKKQAIIFAAGLGTRLKPLTDNIPKVLVEVDGVSMLERIILKLTDHDFKKIVINTHYFAEKIESFINSKHFDAEIILSYEKDVLETGGGLVYAKKYFDEGNILVYNGDILTDIDISELWEEHISNNAIATLASFPRKSTREFIWNEKNNLCGWRNLTTGEYKWSNKTDNFTAMPFAAVHVVNTEIFDLLPKEGKFSLVPHYLEISKTSVIKNQITNSNYWFDIGSKEKLAVANKFFESR